MLYARFNAHRYLTAGSAFRVAPVFLLLGLISGGLTSALAQDSQQDLFFYVIENLDTGQVVRRGTTGARGIPRGGVILAPRTNYRQWLYEAGTGRVGFVEFRTPTAGRRLTVPPIPLGLPATPDGDGDQLSDDAEFVIGTFADQPDSDGDGILDGAEIDQGLDPLEGTPSRTGIIATADTPGTAVDIDAFNDVVVVADSNSGVLVFNVFNRMNPVAIDGVDTPGTAQRVAFSGDFIAVADGSSGLTTRLQLFIPPPLSGHSPSLMQGVGLRTSDCATGSSRKETI